MRLLNTRTLQLEEHGGREVPWYAILSHRWGEEEVLLNQMQTINDETRNLKGFAKIEGCCRQAREDGFSYVWIDTCCIDKTSSSELTEAINSMFNWYYNAVVCYAYLEDLETADVLDNASLLGNSKWFTRGWTLQELIAPPTLSFFGRDWHEIGSREDYVTEIALATAIDERLFLDGHLSEYSVAQRMSWASKRQTTRVEDEAYCLLGIFGVNMPLIYGEGKRAFSRLQEEIMRNSDDQSLFAWDMDPDNSATGILAPCVACFARAGDIGRPKNRVDMAPFFSTNKGIQITLPIIERFDGWSTTIFQPPALQSSTGVQVPSITIATPKTLIAMLNCYTVSKGERVGLAIERHTEDDPYTRVFSEIGSLWFVDNEIGTFPDARTVLFSARGERTNLVDTQMWKPKRFVLQGITKLVPDYELVHIGQRQQISTDKYGVSYTNIEISGKAGVCVFGRKRSFGVFISTRTGQTTWRIVAGDRDKVKKSASAFLQRDEYMSFSCEVERVPLGPPSDTVEELVLETRRRPWGFSSTVSIKQKRDGQNSSTSTDMRQKQSIRLRLRQNGERHGRYKTRASLSAPLGV